MSHKEKLGKAKALFDDIKVIMADPEADTETKNKIEPMLEEARELKAEAAQLKAIDAFSAEFATETEEKQEPDK